MNGLRKLLVIFLVSVAFCSGIIAQSLVTLVALVPESAQELDEFLEDLSKQTVFQHSEIILMNKYTDPRLYEVIANHQKRHPAIRQFPCLASLEYASLLNAVALLSSGKYFFIAHTGNRYKPDMLATLCNILEQYPDFDGVYGDYYESSTQPTHFQEGQGVHITLPECIQALMRSPLLPGPAALWKRSLHNRVGYFRQDFQELASWEFLNRAISRGARFVKIPGIWAIHFEGEWKNKNFDAYEKELQTGADLYTDFWNNQYAQCTEKPMVIVIPSYNNAASCCENLQSVFNQRYANYRIIYIDDASTDNTAQLVQDFIRVHGQQHRVTFIQNTERKGAGANKYYGAQLCLDHEIYIDLDGDDRLAHEYVLAHLNRLYANPDIWVTYGQFIYYPTGSPGWACKLADDVVQSNTVRRHDWVTTALRTFYAGLFKKVDPSYLQLDGKFVPMASDLAFMFCIMEMAGKHSVFVPEILYIYNVTTNLNDATVNRDLQLDLGMKLRAKKPYQPLTHYRQQKKIYITPGFAGDLFNITSPVFNRDGGIEHTYRLRQVLQEKGYELEQTTSFAQCGEAEAVICFEVPTLSELKHLLKYPKEKRILFLWEPPTVLPQSYDKRLHEFFGKVYTWADDLVDNKKYFKFYYPVWRPMIDRIVDFDQKRFCTMIACNKYSNHSQELYSKRKEVIEFFEQYHPADFALYGRGWDGNTYKTYKGTIERKIDCLPQYKFCFCYENLAGMNGYVTEKIFDVMRAGCVPIYWGANNITQYVPQNCFIDRRNFASHQELYEFLKNMSRSQYEDYIRHIDQFMKSSQVQNFTIENFVSLATSLVTGTVPLPEQKPQPIMENNPVYDEQKMYFVTAANAGYFVPLLNLIGSLHRVDFENIGCIAVFDLGLTPEQKDTLQRIEKVKLYEVEQVNPDILKPFNTRAWGKPVPGWYAWKPVIIKQALDIFPSLLYIDAGTTIYRSLEPLFSHIKYIGYFFHSGSPWHMGRMITDYVSKKFQLDSELMAWLFDEDTYGLEGGLMGITREVYEDFVKPMYELARDDLQAFADDGSRGFGNARHDLTLFSLFALRNNMTIYQHFKNPKEDIMICKVTGNEPFHIACNAQDRTEKTHIYASRFDVDLARFTPYIHWRK